MLCRWLGLLVFALLPVSFAQESEVRDRVKAIRDLGKQDSEAIPTITPYLDDVAPEVRAEAVRSLSRIGTVKSLAPLVKATRDEDAEVQIRATDALVSFYLPAYAEKAAGQNLKRDKNGAVTVRFADADDLIVDPYVEVRPEVLMAIRAQLRPPHPTAVRANAARAAGVLRDQAAVPELITGLRSKEDQLIYESLLAIQKMRAREAAPRLLVLTRDLEERIQTAALDTAGLLGDPVALPDIRRVLEAGPKDKVRRAAMGALAMLPDPANRDLLFQALTDKDDAVRAAAAEGIGRIGNSADAGMLTPVFNEDKKMPPRLSAAFALVAWGDTSLTPESPLQFLVGTLNSRSWRGVSSALLQELARREPVRLQLYSVLSAGTPEEQAGLAQVLGFSGAKDALKPLESLSRSENEKVATEATRALRTLRSQVN